MVTTIQVNERTLELLKRIKEQMRMSSYDETIIRIVSERGRGESMAGSLKKYMKRGESLKDLLKDLRDKDDRF